MRRKKSGMSPKKTVLSPIAGAGPLSWSGPGGEGRDGGPSLDGGRAGPGRGGGTYVFLHKMCIGIS